MFRDARARAEEWSGPASRDGEAQVSISFDAVEGRFLVWGTPWTIPNCQVYRKPWGLYVRRKRWRITAGPRFKWRVRKVA